MTVSVVVCSRDRPGQLAACLDAARAALRPSDELLVVDSASQSSETCRVAAAAGARVVRVDRPGLSRARNRGLEEAAGELIAFTDDDCRPEPGWVAAMASAFETDARVAFVTGRVRGTGDGMPVVVLDSDEPRRLDANVPLEELGHGANLALRVSAARAVSGFDELLGVGERFRAAEDTDMCRRLLAAGWMGRYEPGAVVVHEQWRNRWQAIRAARGYGVGFGALAAKARHQGDAGRRLLWRGVGPAGVGRAVRDLASGYPFGAAVCLAWTTGVVAGNLRARRVPVVDGHFVEAA